MIRDGDQCFYADEDAIAALWKGQRFPMRECLSGWAMLTRQSAAVPDVGADPRVPIAAYRPTFVRSMVMVPVGTGRPVAAIGAYWATVRVHVPEREVHLLEALATVTAQAIAVIGTDGAPWAPSFGAAYSRSGEDPGQDRRR